MEDVVRAVLARGRPDRPFRSIAPLGRGIGHVAYLVDGELVVRLQRGSTPDEDAVLREAALLEVVARRVPLRVPDPVIVDPGAGALAYRAVPGRSLLDAPVADPVRLAPALGAFLAALHRTPPSEVRGLVPRDDEVPWHWHFGALHAFETEVARRLPAEARDPIAAFLAVPPPDGPDPDRLVLCHADLGAEHVFTDGAAITGVIDWGDAQLTDPARDLARLLRDLGPAALDAVIAAYEEPFDAADRERAVFFSRCALIEDLAYGLRTGDDRYARAALASLPRTFA